MMRGQGRMRVQLKCAVVLCTCLHNANSGDYGGLYGSLMHYRGVEEAIAVMAHIFNNYFMHRVLADAIVP